GWAAAARRSAEACSARVTGLAVTICTVTRPAIALPIALAERASPMPAAAASSVSIIRIAITQGVGPDRRRSGSRRRCWMGTRGMIMTSRAVRRIAQRASRIGEPSLFQPHHLRIVDAADQVDVVRCDDDGGAEAVEGLEQS